jgi:hypothetical protein
MLVLQMNPLEALFIIIRRGIEQLRKIKFKYASILFILLLWLVELEREGGQK